MDSDTLKPHWDHIQKVLARPSLYIGDQSFRAVASYLAGYNDAWSGALLKGFREWLVLKADHGANFTWDLIAQFLAVRHFNELSAIEDRDAIDLLSALLREFVAERGADLSAAQIITSYQKWLDQRV